MRSVQRCATPIMSGRRAAGFVWGSPIDLSAMRDAQERYAEDLVLDANHDAPHSGLAPPQRRRAGACNAPERDPETARVLRPGKALLDVGGQSDGEHGGVPAGDS